MPLTSGRLHVYCAHHSDASFCMSGDHTLAAAISAVEDVTQEPGVSEWPQ